MRKGLRVSKSFVWVGDLGRGGDVLDSETLVARKGQGSYVRICCIIIITTILQLPLEHCLSVAETRSSPTACTDQAFCSAGIVNRALRFEGRAILLLLLLLAEHKQVYGDEHLMCV